MFQFSISLNLNAFFQSLCFYNFWRIKYKADLVNRLSEMSSNAGDLILVLVDCEDLNIFVGNMQLILYGY